jgi:hypothetical protein
MALARYTMQIRGQLDDALLALLAEFDVTDVPAELVLHDLAMDERLLRAMAERAQQIDVELVARPEEPTHGQPSDTSGR